MIPDLKRVRISSEEQLDAWLARHPHREGGVMLVTHADAAHRKHVSREQVGRALAAHGWTAGPRYTLNAGLLGHKIARAGP